MSAFCCHSIQWDLISEFCRKYNSTTIHTFCTDLQLKQKSVSLDIITLAFILMQSFRHVIYGWVLFKSFIFGKVAHEKCEGSDLWLHLSESEALIETLKWSKGKMQTGDWREWICFPLTPKMSQESAPLQKKASKHLPGRETFVSLKYWRACPGGVVADAGTRSQDSGV